MPAYIKRQDLDTEYYFKEGCHIIEVSNSDDDPNLSIARARVEPGMQTQWHYLDATTERYVILEGQGLVEVGDEPPAVVQSGDVVIIAAGQRQRIQNTGESDLIFLAICSPRFQAEKYFGL